MECMKKQKRKVKRRIKWKAFFLLIFVLFLIGYFFYTIFNLPIKQVLIKGTNLISDYEIMERAGLKEYPKLFKYSSNTIRKKIESFDLVDSVKVKKNLFGKITIEIKEATVLFYNRNNSAYVLSNGKETPEGNFTGVPFLDNYVQSDIYERLIKELANLNPESLSLVSEIEYTPWKSKDVVLDDTRFLFRMNDGIKVYINLIHMDRLDWYAAMYTTLTKNDNFYLFLDSDENVHYGEE